LMYLDTNIIYNYIFETELTTYATEALSAPEPKIISDTAISEAIFVTLRKLAKDEYEINSTKSLREALKSNKVPPEILSKAYSYVKATLAFHNVVTIPENVSWEDTIILAQKYHLLPNDARILATLLTNGADKLATLDKDFQNVSGVVELCPKSFWK